MTTSSTSAAAQAGCRSLLAEHVPEGRVVGMDVSDEMIRHARRKNANLENVMFVIGGEDEIPWDANFFTHAISVESAYYWPDPARACARFFRVLREGGSAWIAINYYRDNPHSHQWSEVLRVPAQSARRRRVGRDLPRRRLSPPSRTSAFPTPLPRPKPTRAAGSATPPSCALSAKWARCWSMA